MTLGNPRLARPSEPVDLDQVETAAFQKRLDLLQGRAGASRCQGIAAPQLGWFQRFFLMRDPRGSSDLVYWINPEVRVLDDEPVWYWEGCLWVSRGLKAYVGRPRAIAVDGFDRNAKALHWDLEDWGAHLFNTNSTIWRHPVSGPGR
ncbi:MAG: peptide deformylase [Pseudomonadota bacterium]|nr:MAG: peptide deformylase [Pseudomonadota bacterium]